MPSDHVQELCDLVNVAEAWVERLKELCVPLCETIEEHVEVEACILAAEEAGIHAQSATKACTDFVNGQDIKDLPTNQLSPGAQPPGTSESKQALGKLLVRIGECGKSTEALIQAVTGAKEQVARRAFAQQKTEERKALFSKYDRDKDQFLNQKEVVTYAKTELSVNVDQVLLDKIWRFTVEKDEKGISFDKLYLLNASLGIAREMKRNERRRTARIAKEKVLAGLREKVKSKVREVERLYAKFDRDMRAAEEAVRPLACRVKNSSVSEMERCADDCDKMVEVCRQTACKVKRRIETIPLGFDKTHCKFFLKYTHNTAACGSMRSFACFLLMCWDSTHPGSMKRT